MAKLLALPLVALLGYTGAVLSLPLPQPRLVAAFTQRDGVSFGHCIRLGGRIVSDNQCLLGAR